MFKFILCIFFITNFLFAEDAYRFILNGDYEKAISLYSFSNDISSKKNLAKICEETGNYEKAIKIYEDILKSLDVSKAFDIYIDLARIYYFEGNLKMAEFFISKAPYSSDDKNRLLFLGLISLDKKNFLDAVSYFEEGLKLNKNFTLLYYYLGKAYRANGNKGKAIENYEMCLAKDSYFVEARMELLNIYLENNSVENAYRQINRIRAVDPLNKEINLAYERIKPQLLKNEFFANKVKKETGFLGFKPFTESSPFIKVGINTDAKGEPNQSNLLVFKSSNDFNFVSNNQVLSGYKGKKYSINLSNHLLHIFFEGNLLKSCSELRLVAKDVSNSFILESVEYGKDTPLYAKSDNQYRGNFDIGICENGIKIINEVKVEEYCYGVISSEILYWWPKEVLKAQAILIRNHAFFKMDNSKHKALGYDVCDGQHCQVYRGIGSEKQNMNDAVDDTRGEVLVAKNGKLVNGIFHSNSGGFVQAARNVYGWADVDYLDDVFEGYNGEKEPNDLYSLACFITGEPKVFANAPSLKTSFVTFRWNRVIKPEYIEKKIIKLHDKNIGDLIDIIVLKRSKSGHVNKILLKGTRGNLIVEKENLIRNTLGLGPLRSTLFWIYKKMNEDGKVIEFIFYGGGWGHGIGMDQTAAASMAEKGYDSDEILKFFYKNTSLKER